MGRVDIGDVCGVAELLQTSRTRGNPPKSRYRRRNRSASVACPGCGSRDSSVLETRTPKAALYVRRRRECGVCGLRYRTVELPWPQEAHQ